MKVLLRQTSPFGNASIAKDASGAFFVLVGDQIVGKASTLPAALTLAGRSKHPPLDPALWVIPGTHTSSR